MVHEVQSILATLYDKRKSEKEAIRAENEAERGRVVMEGVEVPMDLNPAERTDAPDQRSAEQSRDETLLNALSDQMEEVMTVGSRLEAEPHVSFRR
jgi:hypothetical protein